MIQSIIQMVHKGHIAIEYLINILEDQCFICSSNLKLFYSLVEEREGCTSLMQLEQKRNLDKKSKVIESPFSELRIVDGLVFYSNYLSH